MKLHTVELNSLIEAIPDPILIIDHTKTIQGINESVEFLFGYSRESLVGKTIEFLFAECEQGHFSHYYKQQTDGSQTKIREACLELTGLKKNKTEFPIALYCSSLQKQKMMLITIKDLVHQTQLCNKTEELEHSHRAKEQFLATMNHQLRTPLNAVLGFSEILLLKLTGDLTPEQEKQIGIIHKSGKHLLALINDLSDLAKINSGEISFCIEKLNARELILDVMNTLYPLAEEKNLLFIGKLPNKDINISSDKRLLTQIMSNMVHNAIKFTDQGRVLIELSEDKEHAFVHIIDTGVGIKEEKIERLFQPFQQMYIAEKKNEGSGLGLHISKKLADLISVQVEVSSQFGKGTHFTVIIPKADK
jgi:protein-histidine pros-kinase